MQSAAPDSRGLSPTILGYVGAALADSTRRAYRGDLADFLRHGGTVPCSPEVLAGYIVDRADSLSPHTLTRRTVGISRAHTSQGLPDPAKSDLVRAVLRGVRRTKAVKQRQAAPLLKQDVIALLELMRGTRGIRDRALILVGFAAALHRSELVNLDVGDLERRNEGLVVHLRQSKTDQEAAGRKIAVPYGRSSACPVKAVEAWLEHAKIEHGPIFRRIGRGNRIAPQRLTPQSVSLLIKEYVRRAGLSPDAFSGHSLRSGLVTSAAQVGVAAHKIQAQTGHRSTAMLGRYIRDAEIFTDNAAGAVL